MGPAKPGDVELRWQIWLIWFGLFAVLATATRTDPDLWGHVRFGIDWLRTLSLPSVDPYSFTQDRPWVNHEWLSEAVMGAAFLGAGAAGLVVLKTALVAIALWIVWRRLAGATPLIQALILAIALVGALPVTATVRPQLWSLLGLTLVVPLLRETPPGWRLTIRSAILFGVWANLHGGWITGGGALAVHAAVRIVKAPRQAPAWLGLGLASLAATLINPYGVGLWSFLATTVRASRPDISEWLPFSLHEPPLMWVSIIAPTATALLLLRRRDARPRFEALAVLALLVAAGLRVSRVAPLISIAAFALLAPSIAREWGQRGRLAVRDRAAATVLFAPVALVLLAAQAPVRAALTCLPVSDAWAPDRAVAASLVGRSGRLWTTFDWGEYALWHFGPALRVSIDGRRETVYSDEVLAWHRDVEAAAPRALEKLAAAAPDYVWLRAAQTATRDWLVAHGYVVITESDASFLLARRPIPASTMAPLPSCFP